jgi:hypothetical protein
MHTGRRKAHRVELLGGQAEGLERWETFAWDDFGYFSAGIERASREAMVRRRVVKYLAILRER